MLGLTNLFVAFGWSRDDWKWTWGQVVGLAGLVVTGAFNVQHWVEYLGFSISTQHLHWVQAAATVILWISGQMNTSGLFNAKVMKRAEATNQPPAVVAEKIKVEEVLSTAPPKVVEQIIEKAER